MFHPSKPLGMRGSTFQGSSYYTAENPPIGAVFTYYLRDEIVTIKKARQEKEKEISKSGGNIEYPSFDKIRLEDDEIEPHLIFTISDKAGNVIMRINAEPKKGINRMTWDFKYPATTPVQIEKPAFENPFSNPDSGPYALPGTYTAALSKFENGTVTQLVPPVDFHTKLLANTSMPAKDKEALFRFQEETAEFQRVTTGTAKTLEELNTKLKYYFLAINNTPGISDELTDRIVSLDQKLKDLNRLLNGDVSLSKREFPTPPSIMDRVNTIVYGLWQSSSAPTQTQISSLKIAKTQFREVYNRIKEITLKDVATIEADLERSGAPWTPGRLPEWKE
jgi:hypothetical protein